LCSLTGRRWRFEFAFLGALVAAEFFLMRGRCIEFLTVRSCHWRIAKTHRAEEEVKHPESNQAQSHLPLSYGFQIAVITIAMVVPLLLQSVGDSGAVADRGASEIRPPKAPRGSTVFIPIGDSLTHGTMDGTNNSLNTLHVYAQLLADSLSQVVPLEFVQPLFDENQDRIDPSITPTNLAVDGADVFSVEGLSYYKSVGADATVVSDQYLCNVRSPRRFDSKYDKVLYPINK